MEEVKSNFDFTKATITIKVPHYSTCSDKFIEIEIPLNKFWELVGKPPEYL